MPGWGTGSYHIVPDRGPCGRVCSHFELEGELWCLLSVWTRSARSVIGRPPQRLASAATALSARGAYVYNVQRVWLSSWTLTSSCANSHPKRTKCQFYSRLPTVTECESS